MASQGVKWQRSALRPTRCKDRVNKNSLGNTHVKEMHRGGSPVEETEHHQPMGGEPEMLS